MRRPPSPVPKPHYVLCIDDVGLASKSKLCFLSASTTRKAQTNPDAAPAGITDKTFSRGLHPQTSVDTGTAAPRTVPSSADSSRIRFDACKARDRNRIQQ